MHRRHDDDLGRLVHYYIGTYSGIYRSPDARTWTKVPNSPLTDAITGDGARMPCQHDETCVTGKAGQETWTFIQKAMTTAR